MGRRDGPSSFPRCRKEEVGAGQLQATLSRERGDLRTPNKKGGSPILPCTQLPHNGNPHPHAPPPHTPALHISSILRTAEALSAFLKLGSGTVDWKLLPHTHL